MSSTLQTEKEILGEILLAEEAFWDVADVLSPASFVSKDHQAIFSAMSDLARSNRAIRATALSTRLNTLSDDLEPLVYLSQLIEVANKARERGAVSVVENAEDLHRAFVKRRTLALLKLVDKEANSATTDPVEVLEKLISEASDLIHDADQKSERNVAQVGADVSALVQKAVQDRGIGLTTGLHTVDDMIGRVFPGDFILFGGMPGGGKTSLAMQIALHVAKTQPVAFIELEMESRMLLLRTVAGETGIPVRRMLDGIRDGEFGKITDAIQGLAHRKLNIVAQRGMTIAQIEARIRSMKRRYGIKLAVIDHLGLIKRPGKYRVNKHEKDFDNAEDLMELGKALGIPILALCHLTKAARQKDGDPEPTMEDFSGGGMEQHADLMICTFNRHDWLLRNKPKIKGQAAENWQAELRTSENRMELFKLKDRKGAMRQRLVLHWDGARTMFSDLKVTPTDMFANEEEMAL